MQMISSYSWQETKTKYFPTKFSFYCGGFLVKSQKKKKEKRKEILIQLKKTILCCPFHTVAIIFCFQHNFLKSSELRKLSFPIS